MNSGGSIALLLLVLTARLPAQETEDAPALLSPTDRLAKLSAEAGLGLSVKHYPEERFSYDRIGGITAHARLEWRIREFFGLSLETGWIGIAGSSAQVVPHSAAASGSAMPADASLSLRSIPVVLSVHLCFPRFSIDPGLAVHVVSSSIDAFGEQSSTTKLDLAYALGGSYSIPIGDRISLVAGLSAHYLVDLRLLLFLPRVGISTALLLPG